MLGFGPPSEPKARRAWWQRQIQRQRDTQIPVAEFCRHLGVQPHTFYAWRQRLCPTPAVGRPARDQRPNRPKTAANGTATTAFLPVSIRDAAAPAPLEIVLANACVVRLHGDLDPKLLRVAIRAAGRLDQNGQGAT